MGVAVFLAGGVLLGLEIAASRVVAPYFGNSLFVWGALIGVVLAGLSTGFTFTADGHDAGTPVSGIPSVVLMQLPNARPGVLVRDFGSGKVVNFSFAPNYPLDEKGELRVGGPTMLNQTNIKKLYINAVRWVSGSASGQAQPQTIDFAALSDKVYGQPAFSIQADSSSGLPVSFTAAGGCQPLREPGRPWSVRRW